MKSIGTSMPALPVAIGLSAGIAVYGLLSPSVWIGAILILLGLLAVRMLNRSQRSLLVAFGVGILVSWYNRPGEIPPDRVGEKIEVSGTVADVSVTDLTTRIVISPKDEKMTGRLLVTYRGAAYDIRPGMTVSVIGKVNVPDSVTDLPWQTDFNRYLKLDGIVGRMNVYSRSDLVVTDSSRGIWDRFCDAVGSGWLEAIARAGFDEQTTAFMLAVLGGDDMLLDSMLEDRFRDNGLAHLLAISGLHVAIIVMLLGWMLYAMKFSMVTRRLYYIILMVAVGLFTVASGGSPSVSRAAVMAVVMLGCGLFETVPDARQALAVSVSVCLLFKPMWLYAPGFQLSVVAVAGLLTFGRLTDRLPVRNRALRMVLDLLVIPVVALVSTVVLTIFYFHSIPLNFWIANVCAAIFVPFVLGVGFVTVIIGMIGFPTAWPAGLTDALSGQMNRVVESVGELGGAPMTIFLSDVELCLVGLSVLTLGWLCVRPGRLSGMTAAVVVAATTIALFLTDREIPAAELYVPRHSWSTDIIIADNGRVFVWTVSRRGNGDTGEMLERNYRDFFRHRGDTRPETLPDSYNGAKVTRRGDLISVGPRKLGVIRSDSVVPDVHLDYALLTADFRGNVVKLCEQLDADTVLLPRQMHSRRALKLISRLNEVGVPVRRLTDRPLALVVE